MNCNNTLYCFTFVGYCTYSSDCQWHDTLGFCNFDNGGSGYCEYCSDIFGLCEDDGFITYAGEQECKRTCEG